VKRRGWAAIPHDIIEDPRLLASDIRVLGVLVRFARSGPDCWPAVRTIASAAQCSPRTVQLCLRRLERAGVVATIDDPAKVTHRRFVLLWRTATGSPEAPVGRATDCTPPMRELRDPPAQSVALELQARELEKAPRQRSSSPSAPLASEWGRTLQAAHELEPSWTPFIEQYARNHPDRADWVRAALANAVKVRKRDGFVTLGYLVQALAGMEPSGPTRPATEPMPVAIPAPEGRASSDFDPGEQLDARIARMLQQLLAEGISADDAASRTTLAFLSAARSWNSQYRWGWDSNRMGAFDDLVPRRVDELLAECQGGTDVAPLLILVDP
jgi:hypothetical protein